MKITLVSFLVFIALLNAQFAYSEGIADRKSEVWQVNQGIQHVHSNQALQTGVSGGTDSLADKKANQGEAVEIIDHIHHMHGPTAAGGSGDYNVHDHKAHRHTAKSGWMKFPKEMTGHQRKRLMFDYNGPHH